MPLLIHRLLFKSNIVISGASRKYLPVTPYYYWYLLHSPINLEHIFISDLKLCEYLALCIFLLLIPDNDDKLCNRKLFWGFQGQLLSYLSL